MIDLLPIDYSCGNVALRGQIARPAGEGLHPGVLVMHSALGIREHELDSARKLAALGFVALVTDMYGAGSHDLAGDAAGAKLVALQGDHRALRARAAAGLAVLAGLDGVDAGRIGAIGYCFGGQCVLELARSGAALDAVVSFHGLLTTAEPAAPGAIKGEVAVFTGAEDPYAPAEHVEALRSEMSAARARWQIMVFGQGAHGFTDPSADALKRDGISYDRQLDAVSWAAATALLHETLH